MKILHVTKKYPNALGGDAVVVANLQKQQRMNGHRVLIVTSNCAEISDGPGIYKFGLRDSPAKLDAITPRRIVSLIMLFFKMFAVLRRERPDIIHTHSIDMAFFVSFAARLYKIPMVHTFHIVTFYDQHQSVLRRTTELWLAKKAQLHRVTAPNNYDVKKLVAAGLAQTVLLPNGVDLGFWKPALTATKNNDFVFLAIGRLENQKGYEYLIKAAALLVDSLPAAFHIVIVGEGSQGMELRALTHDLGLESTVSFVGHKNPEEVRALMAHASAAVTASLYETTPLTLLEAWAAAVPVIATSVGIVRDAPPDYTAAYVVPPGDEQSLMRAMSHCMSNAEARRAIAAEGEAEAKKYAWPVVAHTAEIIYRSVR